MMKSHELATTYQKQSAKKMVTATAGNETAKWRNYE
jgi:hypothetical protein